MNPRPLLPDAQRTPAVAEAIASFHAATVREVSESVQREPIVVVGMAQNPFVRKARAALEGAQIPFTYLEYGSYLAEWKRRLAIKLWSGWPTFPQVFVRGTLIGGHKELVAALADGSLRQRLSEAA